MASNRKKQDEKHLKILRNLVSLPYNKQCFDCSQKGPTYVNTTIGSFVCTTCSGMLRGLTPPHRVKSISMATFTPEEVDLLKTRGNEYCKNVWLALYDSNSIHDVKNEQRVKDFMVAKYERKQYFMEPTATMRSSNGVSDSHSATIQPHNDTFTNHKTQTSQVTKINSLTPPSASLKLLQPVKPKMFSPDSSSTFTSPDLFAPVQSQQPVVQDTPSFANFDNNPVFNTGPPLPTMSASASFPVATKPRPPSEDRYAALKDLDSIMKKQQEPTLNEWSSHPKPVTTEWPSVSGNGGWPMETPSSNPFQTQNFNDISSSPNTRNPFRSNEAVSNAWTSPWSAMPSSQSMPFPTSNWNGNGNITIGSGKSSNPFL